MGASLLFGGSCCCDGRLYETGDAVLDRAPTSLAASVAFDANCSLSSCSEWEWSDRMNRFNYVCKAYRRSDGRTYRCTDSQAHCCSLGVAHSCADSRAHQGTNAFQAERIQPAFGLVRRRLA